MKEINYYNESGQSIFRLLILLSLFLSLILLTYSIYIFYINTPRNPENMDIVIAGETEYQNITLDNIRQFQPNMKFNKNNLSYKIDPFCDSSKTKKMKEAFEILSKDVGNIFFYETDANATIEVECSNDKKINEGKDNDFFIAGEGGGKDIIKTGRFNIITTGIILLYNYPIEYEECNTPNIELHELLHVFGFDHTKNQDSIMYPYLSCKQKLDESIILELKKLYSEPNLADLYFEDASAIKKGRYLDFNMTIKNSGVIDAENVTFSIIDDGEIVETKKLGTIKYGAGVTIKIENLKLIHLNPKRIIFKIDNYNLIKEIDKKNNIAEIKFNS